MNATNTKSNAMALLGALLLATAAAPAAAAGDTGAPSPQSVLNASMAQRDAMALLGVLMLAGASNSSLGTTLGVVLLVVAADGVRVPARMPSATLPMPWHEDFRRHGTGNPLLHTY
jgi:hypothetical protein